MKITTSRNETYDAEFAFAPTTSGNLVIRLPDKGERLAEICAAFEGNAQLEYHADNRDDAPVTLFNGYTRMLRVSREGSGIVIILSKGG